MKIKIKTPFSWSDLLGGSQPQIAQSLDFQPADVILQGPQPLALPYNQTGFHLIIHIDRVRQGKNRHVTKVVQLTFEFNENGQIYSLEHACTIEDIFPLLDYADRFAGFSYSFQRHTSHWDTDNYQQFVKQQIRNHQLYGIHLPFSERQALSTWFSMFLFGFMSFCLIHFSHINQKGGGYILIMLGIAMAIAALACGWSLWRYYRIKNQLSQLEK